MNYENCVGIQFPPTPTTTFARSIPRIQPNQQSARYTSRTKLATLAIWEEEKKKSKDKTQELLAPPRLGGFRNVESLGTPAPSVAPGQEESMEVDDADELNALGLPVSEPSKKKRRSGNGLGQRARTKEEAFSEEIEKLSAKFQEAISDMENVVPQVPALTKLGKSLQVQGSKAREEGLYAPAAEADRTLLNLNNVKECLRASSLYLPASGVPNLKHQEVFFNALNALDPPLRSKLPIKLRNLFRHLLHAKDFCVGSVWFKTMTSYSAWLENYGASLLKRH